MRVGFIGTGSMGSILIGAFIQSGALEPQQITVSNRTESKAILLREQFPELCVVQNVAEVVSRSDLTFICVKPHEFKGVIDDIRSTVTPDHIIVSITSPLSIKLLEGQLRCKIAKVIPSITNYVCSGVSLCMYGENMTLEDQAMLESLLAFISTPQQIDEHYTRVTSDLSSCGPAFLCFFLEKFIEAAVQETGIPHAEATSLAGHMLLGTGKLLTSGSFTPVSLQQRVSVPGGITAEGLHLMSKELDGLFNQLIRTTHAKYDEDVIKVEALFNLRQD